MSFTSILLRLIHYVCVVKDTLLGVLNFAKKPLQWTSPKSGHSRTQADVADLKRVPVHLGIVLVEDDVSYEDVSNLIIWCMLMGITYISIYDRSGFVKQNRKMLSSCLEGRKDKLLGSEKHKYDVHIHQGKKCRSSGEGCLGKTSVDVILLSADDGRKSIVQTAKHLSLAVRTLQFKCSDITPSSVDSLMQEENGFPDPSLILKFGRVESLQGYLPWQMRLAEILSLPSHHGFDYSSFCRALQSFGNIEMRFGK